MSRAKREYDETRSVMGSGHMRSIVQSVATLANAGKLKRLRLEVKRLKETQKKLFEHFDLETRRCGVGLCNAHCIIDQDGKVIENYNCDEMNMCEAHICLVWGL